jgi:hypothetical protein
MKKSNKTLIMPCALREDGPIALGITFVDTLLDKIVLNKIKNFDTANIEQLRKLTIKEIKVVFAHCERTLLDFKEALSGDTFLIEAYSNFNKPQMKLAVEYLKHIHKLKPDESVGGRKIRLRQQTKKQKPPEQLVLKVLYLEHDKETDLNSLKPEVIIRCKEMWVYNTKTRKLGCYYTKTDAGLSVKGTTVLNYNIKLSMTKTIRRPKLQLHDFMANQSYWDEIRAVPQKITPRLNRTTLILKAKPSNI